MEVEITRVIEPFAIGDHDVADLPHPMPADCWLWGVGDTWMAQVAVHHLLDWWEGADDAALAERPVRWARHILQVPDTGVLLWHDEQGAQQRHDTGRCTT